MLTAPVTLESLFGPLPSGVVLVVYATVLGAVFASFSCVVVERGRSGESVMGRSHCVCGRQLRAVENIPVLGWLRARGVARCCGAKIPSWYVRTEAATAALWGALAVYGGRGVLLAAAVTTAGTAFARQRVRRISRQP